MALYGALRGKTLGWALSASHHTLPLILPVMRDAVAAGAEVIPVVSHTVVSTPTKHGTPEDWLGALRAVTGREPLRQIPEVEPFGPQRTCDCVLIAPMTGNTLARFANAVTDSAPLMAAKAQLRNGGPVVVSITTNDALGLNAKNLAVLLNTRNVYFVPFGQDSPSGKPGSLVAHLDRLLETVEAAMAGRQLQPLLVPW